MSQRLPKKSPPTPRTGGATGAPSSRPRSSPYSARNLLKTSPKLPEDAKALSRAAAPERGSLPPPTRTKVRPQMSQKSTNTQSQAQARREEEYTEDSPEQTAVRAAPGGLNSESGPD